MTLFLQLFSAFLISCSALFCTSDVEKYFAEFCPGNRQYCRAAFRHIEAGGIGYDKGYTTFEAFGALDPREHSLIPFLDLRGHIFNNGKFAANIGGGLRKLAGCRVYGGNIYYDFRDTKRLNYNQLGVGLETLGSRWDFRLNGYIPLGTKITCPYDLQIVDFSDHYLIVSQQYQLAMDAAQAEFGIHFATSKYFTFYATAGVYYLHGAMGPNAWGGKARFLIQFKEYWTLELSNSYDKIFHDRFQCQLTFTVPLGKKSGSEQSCAQASCSMAEQLCARMAQPVQRQEIVIVEQITKCSRAINPDTDQPYYFVFVDNTSNSAGTYESPYPTLALAQANSKAGDIIYVFPGDGTTKGMNAGIVLKSKQNLWGSGISYPISTAQGDVVIPAQSSTAPKITNTDVDAITLSDINQVKGIHVVDVVRANGIAGSNISNIEIAQCDMSNCEADHIHLESSRTSAQVTMSDLNLTTADVYTVYLNSSASSKTTCIMQDCVMDDNVNGISLNFSGPATVSISGNTMTNTSSISSAPIEINMDTDPVRVSIADNTISNNTCSAARFVLNNTDDATIMINSNTISNNGTGSQASLGSPLVLNLNNTTVASGTLNVTGNTMSGNDGYGLNCVNGDFDSFTSTVTDNSLTGNGGGLVFANDCTDFVLTVDNNIISQGSDNGIAVIPSTITTADITISNNQITQNTNQANAIAITHDSTDLTLVISNNNLSSNEGSGILMYSAGGVTNATATITGNTVSHNQNLGSNAAGGIDLEQYTNFAATISNNTLLDNATHGMYVASTDPSPSVCLTMTGNTNDTDYVLVGGTGTFNLAPCAVASLNTGTITLVDTVTLVASCPGGTPCV